tara:strand:- start:271 stop:579 length:309 start_codon:yes stop_codon:yes gene_type:complete
MAREFLRTAPSVRANDPRTTGLWMNPEDFKKKYGYDYTDDPNFDSRSDAGGVVPPGSSLSMPQANTEDVSAFGSGYGKKRSKIESRGQMDFTKGQNRTLLTG